MKRALLLALIAGCATSSAPPRPLGMTFVRIPAGEFLMGSSPEEAARAAAEMKAKGITDWYPESPKGEAPPRRTRLSKDFWLAAHETTLGQFRAFVEATGYRSDAERDGKGADGKRNGKWTTAPEFNWRHMGYERGEDQPVVNVTWADAAAFCEWLTKSEGRRYRLPTEAEWEYACRAGTTTRYYWGDDAARRPEHAWSGIGDGPRPVGRLRPNAWGLYDMLGNAYEYCADWYAAAPYDPAQDVDPKGPPSGKEHVVRSTSWGTNPMHARCAFRGGSGPPEHRNMRDGFRVAAD